MDERGRRCNARGDLEFHHRKPYGRGGDHSPGNLALLCSVHNTLLAERDYGEQKMAQYRRSGSRVSEGMTFYGSGPPLPAGV